MKTISSPSRFQRRLISISNSMISLMLSDN
jgi:hypothetical protein